MEKIGILTFHRAHNYGAILQAYGLQEYLKHQGYDVSVVDYCPSYLLRIYAKYSIRHWFSKYPLQAIKRLLTGPFLYRNRAIRWTKFNRFIETKLNLYPLAFNDRLETFDTLILGSDQIWNQGITGGRFDDMYFGGQAVCRIVSYAASNRTSELSVQEKEYYTEKLRRISAIGVREELLRTLLQPLTDKPITTTIDPTLLAGRSIFKQIAISPKQKQPYVLLYEIESHSESYNIAQSIADQLHANIIELVSEPSILRMWQRDQTASPEEFVGYFEHAACVITTSFHGVAFSVMFNRPFYAIRQQNSADLRIDSLLSKIGLSCRFVNKQECLTFTEINYSLANQSLSFEVARSESFLRQALM